MSAPDATAVLYHAFGGDLDALVHPMKRLSEDGVRALRDARAPGSTVEEAPRRPRGARARSMLALARARATRAMGDDAEPAGPTRRRLVPWLVLAACVFCLGDLVPLPGVDHDVLAELGRQSGSLGLFGDPTILVSG